MASRGTVQLLGISDFGPGLRLDADAFQLRGGESPSLLNVDLEPLGGLSQRKTVAPLIASSAPLTKPIHSMFAFANTSGTEQLLVGSGTHTFYSTGSAFVSVGTTWTSSARQRAVSHRDALYIVNGVDAPRKWTGSAVSNLTQTFISDLTTSTDGNMPIAKTICAWQGYVWVANTVESATAHKSRLRFSHPNRAERWRADDYIDIDVGRDGDEITALVPMQDRLLVFKNRSLHVVTGYDPDTFAVNFYGEVGAPAQEAVAVTEYGVYWFSWPDGVYMLTDRGISYQFQQLYPAIRDGQIPDAYHAMATVGWLGRRVWVSVPWEGSTDNQRVFVLDPKKKGGWTQYDLALGPLLLWRRAASDTLALAATSSTSEAIRVLKLDEDADTDLWHSNYLSLPGTDNSVVTTPDSAALSITGDIDVRMLIQAADYTPTSDQILLAKWGSSNAERSWRLWLRSGGGLQWVVRGAAEVTTNSTATLGSVGITDGMAVWVRVTHDVDNGAGGNAVQFFYSHDASTWTQLGTTVTNAGTGSINDSASQIEIGRNADHVGRYIGKVHAVEIRQGIAGTVRASPDFTSQSSAVTSVTDAQGNVWTLGSAASLSVPSGTFSSYYFTNWFDAGTPVVAKRWKRPEIVMDADNDVALRIGVYRDYEPTYEHKAFTVNVTGETAAEQWGSSNWGTLTWSSEATGAQTIEQGTLLGRARSVALRIEGPTPSARWSINALNFKYVPRRVR